MSLVIITGPARSGKSLIAEQLAAQRQAAGESVCVVVFAGQESDPLQRDRIAYRRAQRPEGFSTLEAHEGDRWLSEVGPDELLLVDSLGEAISAHMRRVFPGPCPDDVADPENLRVLKQALDAARDWVVSFTDVLAHRQGDTIVVVEQAGSGLAPEDLRKRLFLDLLGAAGRRLVGYADASWLCVAGRLIELGALPFEISWPED